MVKSIPNLPRIGVLDSGVGGLSVLRDIHRLLPQHPTLYFGDQGHQPYGPRSAAEIHTYIRATTQFLTQRGAQVIVLACHAASAASLLQLRAEFPNIPFVGIEPAIKPAAERTRSGVVAVLTTQATADGVLYRRVLAKFASHTQVYTIVAPKLVQIVEENSVQSPACREISRHYLQPALDAGADQIVLACTHFPFLIDVIGDIAGSDVTLVDPGPAVARQTARMVAKISPHDPLSNGEVANHLYVTSGDPIAFHNALSLLLKLPSANVQRAEFDPTTCTFSLTGE